MEGMSMVYQRSYRVYSPASKNSGDQRCIQSRRWHSLRPMLPQGTPLGRRKLALYVAFAVAAEEWLSWNRTMASGNVEIIYTSHATGRCFTPYKNEARSHSSAATGTTKRKFRRRCKRVLMAMAPSSRASGAPRQ